MNSNPFGEHNAVYTKCTGDGAFSEHNAVYTKCTGDGALGERKAVLTSGREMVRSVILIPITTVY
jgi:hypothetical protein